MELFYPSVDIPVEPRPTALHPSSGEAGGIEMLPVIEPSGIVVARSPRSYVHGGSMLLHPVVHLHVLSRDGDLYLQKRGACKDLLPGYWDTAVGGHVSFGDTIMEALYREAGEELGLYDFNPSYLGSYIFESPRERELVNVFAVVGNYSPSPDGTEVEDGRWWTMKEIEESLGNNVLTPNFEGEFERIKDALAALL